MLELETYMKGKARQSCLFPTFDGSLSVLLNYRVNLLEMILYADPPSQLKERHVEQDLETSDTIDHEWSSRNSLNPDALPGHYVTDVKLKSINTSLDISDYALRFTTPLLIESGICFSVATLEEALAKDLYENEEL